MVNVSRGERIVYNLPLQVHLHKSQVLCVNFMNHLALSVSTDHKTTMIRATCFLLLLVSACRAHDINVINNLGYTIWVGVQANDGSALPNEGGFQLDDGQTVTVTVADGWGGRFWGRTNCNFDADGNGQCETGDCGNGLRCNGNGGAPPTTLAEIRFNGDGNQDFYDISLVNGFNLPLSIGPTDPANDGSLSCTTASCTADVNGGCPGNLPKTNGGGTVVGCQATCDMTLDPVACCTGAYGTPDSGCNGGESAGYFKQQCPSAYSYAYDDDTSLHTCPVGRTYNVRFGS